MKENLKRSVFWLSNMIIESFNRIWDGLAKQLLKSSIFQISLMPRVATISSASETVKVIQIDTKNQYKWVVELHIQIEKILFSQPFIRAFELSRFSLSSSVEGNAWKLFSSYSKPKPVRI